MDKAIALGLFFIAVLIIGAICAFRFVFGTGEMDMGFRVLFVMLLLFCGAVLQSAFE